MSSKELAERKGVRSFLIDDASHINPEWLIDVDSIGLTAGASAPEKLVKDVIAWLNEYDETLAVESLSGEPENMVFALPKELRLVQTT